MAWGISRIEILHLNPRYKRWQIFHEGLTEPQQLPSEWSPNLLYRRQIQQLLKTARKCFDELIRGTQVSQASDSNSQAEYSISLPAKQLGAVQPLTGTICNYYKQLARSELGGGNRWVEDVMEEVANINAGGNGSEAAKAIQLSRKLTAEQLYELLSLLVILPEWDLPGCWWRIRSQTTPTTAADPFPGPLHPSQWLEPFYLASFNYVIGESSANASSPQTYSREIFRDYSYEFEALALDLSLPGMRPVFCPAGDYFADGRCWLPQDNAEDRPGERALYRFYSSIYDGIVLALEGHEWATQSKNQRIHVASYALSPSAWTDFLNVHLRNPDKPDADVAELWNAWLPVHNRLVQSDLRRFLAEGLDRARITLFQAQLHERLRELAQKPGQNQDELWNCVASELCLALPLKKVAWKNWVWEYSPSNFSDTSNQIFVGHEWKRSQNSPDDPDANGLRIGELTLYLDTTHSRPTVAESSRAIQVVEQQLALAHLSLAAMRKWVEEARAAHETKRREHELKLLSQALARPGLPGSAHQTGEDPRETAEPLLAYGQSWDDEPARQRATRWLTILQSAGLNALVSAVLERGPIKSMTHQEIPSADCSNFAAAAQWLRNAWSRIQPAVDFPEHRDYVKDLEALITQACDWLDQTPNQAINEHGLAQYAPPADVGKLQKKLVKKHQELFQEVANLAPPCGNRLITPSDARLGARACVPFSGVIVPANFSTYVEEIKGLCQAQGWAGPQFHLFRLPWALAPGTQYDNAYAEVLWRNYLAIRWGAPQGGKWPDSWYGVAQEVRDCSIWFAGERTEEQQDWRWVNLTWRQDAKDWEVWPSPKQQPWLFGELHRARPDAKAAEDLRANVLKRFSEAKVERCLLIVWHGWDVFAD